MNKNSSQHFFQDQTGAAMTEFALLAPIFIVVGFGMFELKNYMTTAALLDEITAQVSNWTSVRTTKKNINDFIIGAWNLGQSINFSTKGSIYITGVSRSDNKNQVVWSASAQGTSVSFSGSGGTVSLPGQISLANGDQLIVVQVKYTHQPVIPYFTMFANKNFDKTIYAMPRGSGVFSPLPDS